MGNKARDSISFLKAIVVVEVRKGLRGADLGRRSRALAEDGEVPLRRGARHAGEALQRGLPRGSGRGIDFLFLLLELLIFFLGLVGDNN